MGLLSNEVQQAINSFVVIAFAIVKIFVKHLWRITLIKISDLFLYS